MFTGIIEDLGIVKKINKALITVETKLSGIKIGDSVCVNGVCLTAYRLTGSQVHKFTNSQVRKFTGSRVYEFTADISEETYNRTNLGRMKPNDKVNLERALRSDGRLGGHFVTGHIDGTGKILKIKKLENSEVWYFSIPENLSKYITEKGSVCLDGISLTVVEKKPDLFSVVLIPHTLKNTIFKEKKIGDTVNLETDMLAKYIFVQNNAKSNSEKNKITSEALRKVGFL
ncbi:MAG: riboflavin synthase [Elusimicrobiota bacterium]